MGEQIVRANGIDICYETFGRPFDPVLLLVMGFGVQMTEWEPAFCQEFAAAGFYLIRFDNRDTGRSTHFPPVEPGSAPPYSLNDMADDADALLRALGIDGAHVLGTSMGGMIAQTLAIRHPGRVRSLCTIMSSTGRRDLPGPTAEALAAIAAPLPQDRGAVIEAAVARARVLRGGGFPFDEQAVRRRAADAFDRCFDPPARLRQRLAISTADDRTAALAQLRLPVVVIHGSADPLIPLAAGVATAHAVPDAELIVIDGMGHEVPVAVRPRIVAAVVRNAARAGGVGAVAGP